MTQREWGTGSIECRLGRRGHRYRARIRLPDGTRSVLGVFDTEQEAASVIAATAEQLAASTAEPSTGVSLVSYGTRWLDQRERHGKRNAENERSCWNKHIAGERFAIGPLSDITKRNVRDWVRSLTHRRVTQTVRTREGLKSKTGSRTLARETVKHALNLAPGAARGASKRSATTSATRTSASPSATRLRRRKRCALRSGPLPASTEWTREPQPSPPNP
jgi:hypothetical protein